MPLVRRSFALTALLAALAATPFAATASAAPGQLDPTFGTGGSVRLLPSNEDIALRGVATQPDGKIVLAGSDFTTETTLVVRLLENGALDPGFGAGGIVSLKLGTEASEARAVLVQPDGKIVLAGTAKGATTYDFMFARLNTDGSPDPSFGGGDGNELVPVGAKEDRAEAVSLGPGGRIVATGEARSASDVAAGVVVLGANGLPDPGYFGGDGATAESTVPKNDEGVAVAMLADGRVLLGDANGAGAGKGFTLIQLSPAGARDPAFGGGDGLVEAPVPSGGTESNLGGRISDFELLADGRIDASGYGYDEATPNDNEKMAVARFLADGQLDESFGSAGWFGHQFGPGSESAESIEVAPTGKLLIAGPYDFALEANGAPGRAVARLEANGTLDSGFGAGGSALSGETAPFGEIFGSAALDSEERLVYDARAYIGGGNTEIVVSRYLGDKVPAVALPAAVRRNQAPHARMKKVPKKVKASRLRGFAGSASDPDGALGKVQVALLKLIPGGAKASAKRPRPMCLALKNAKVRFKPVRPKGKQRCRPHWLTAKGTAKWSFHLKRDLAPGHYVVYARAVDSEGLAEPSFSRELGNRYAFRVLPPPPRR